jgi:hypothetical protein
MVFVAALPALEWGSVLAHNGGEASPMETRGLGRHKRCTRAAGRGGGRSRRTRRLGAAAAGGQRSGNGDRGAETAQHCNVYLLMTIDA